MIYPILAQVKEYNIIGSNLQITLKDNRKAAVLVDEKIRAIFAKKGDISQLDCQKKEKILASIFGEPSSYKEIQLTTLETIRNIFLYIITIGIYAGVVTGLFHGRLLREDIKGAADALRYGAIPYLNRNEIADLAYSGKKEALRFYAAQLVNKKNLVINRGGLEQFLIARDDVYSNRREHEILVAALPYGSYFPTHLDRKESSSGTYSKGPGNDEYFTPDWVSEKRILVPLSLCKCGINEP